MLPDDGRDEEDGSENNAVRRRALDLMARSEDDLSDVEIVLRLTDEGAFVSFCIDELRRLPSEVEPVLTCREWTLIQARGIVRQAQQGLARMFANSTMPKMPDA